jgi:hypothetical protein
MRWLSRVSVKGARACVSIKASRDGVNGSRVGVNCYRVSVSPSLRRIALTEGGLRRQHLVGVLLGPVLEQGLEQLRMRHHPGYCLAQERARTGASEPWQPGALRSSELSSCLCDSIRPLSFLSLSLSLSLPPFLPPSLDPSLSLSLCLSPSLSLSSLSFLNFATISFDFGYKARTRSCLQTSTNGLQWRTTRRFDRQRSATGAPE